MCGITLLHMYLARIEPYPQKENPYKRASVDQLVNFSRLLYIHRIRFKVIFCLIFNFRFKTKMLEENEVDSQGDMAGISIRDLEIILAKHGLPTSKSGTALNALSLNGFLDKARGVFNAKISKG